MRNILIAITLIATIVALESARVYQSAYENLDLNQHSVKIVNYAVKVGNKLQLKTIGVKNPDLMGDPGWIGQGIWIKNYYNSTGYLSFKVFL